jgi:isopropylmalate/homocitrate/citramalate synthase
MSVIGDLLYSWGRIDRRSLSDVRLEEDIRDALQCVRTTAPTIEQRRRLLDLSDQVGVHYAFLGFPAASGQDAAGKPKNA